MRFKGFLAAVLIAVSTLALPTALTVAPALTGCTTSQQRKTVNTIATLGHAADASFKGYLELVWEGKLPTNSVPAVARSYSVFQEAYNAALTLAVMNTNAGPTVDLRNAASQLQLAITAAKGK